MPGSDPPSAGREDLLRWIAGLGAVTAEALAGRDGCSVASARSRMLHAERAGLLASRRPLSGRPALYAITSAGRRACGMPGLDPCRVTPANAAHLIACAEAATALAGCYPDHRVMGERELRLQERERGVALASATLRCGSTAAPVRHRPDLVLWPADPGDGLPVAVEIELTVKAPRRLAAICLAWARCRCVAGVLYLAADGVQTALGRAVERARAQEMIAVVPLGALPVPGPRRGGGGQRSVPGGS